MSKETVAESDTESNKRHRPTRKSARYASSTGSAGPHLEIKTGNVKLFNAARTSLATPGDGDGDEASTSAAYAGSQFQVQQASAKNTTIAANDDNSPVQGIWTGMSKMKFDNDKNEVNGYRINWQPSYQRSRDINQNHLNDYKDAVMRWNRMKKTNEGQKLWKNRQPERILFQE